MDLTPLLVEETCPTCSGSGKQQVLSGVALRAIRQSLPAPGISGRALAAQLGLKPTFWNDVERGGRPLPEKHAAKALKILRELGWSGEKSDASGPRLVHGQEKGRPE